MDSIWLIVAHESLPIQSEKKYALDTTVAQLKGKLEMIVGVPPHHMALHAKGAAGDMLLANGAQTLRAYGLTNHTHITVRDTSGGASAHAAAAAAGQVYDVEKYEMSDADYDKRTDSIRAMKKRMGLKTGGGGGSGAADGGKGKGGEPRPEHMAVGMRCQVGGDEARRGVVRFIGTTSFRGGWWVGVQLDTPVGKHDGSVKGVRYFECAKPYGQFFQPSQLRVGDYPEIDLLGLDDSDSDDEL